MISAELKHPEVVQQFYQTRGVTIHADKSCCTNKYKMPNVGMNHFSFQVSVDNHENDSTNERSNGCAKRFTLNLDLPFPQDINSYIVGHLLPEHTNIQKERNDILRRVSSSQNFQDFLLDTYNMFLDLFDRHRLPPKKNQM